MNKKNIDSYTIANLMENNVQLFLHLLNCYIEEYSLQDEPVSQVIDCLGIDAANEYTTACGYLCAKYMKYV